MRFALSSDLPSAYARQESVFQRPFLGAGGCVKLVLYSFLPPCSNIVAMAGVLKKTTGLVGLAVCNNPHERLKILYTKILGALENMPKDAAYRKYTEKLINERFDMVKTEPNVQNLEKKLNSGQIEEVILQAESELSLARKMLKYRPWEPLVEEPPENQWKWPI
ncbi:NADH dehydrogenase [ubiquinone] 1 alpha subcomplex subunit 5 [Candoia aspera]|uniref:NADH dehydrogenase [ubiquinone] 1 alpha subcomplex subunit 5 n=1 Tax=Candoia aspera TaxID=51853 RepID=UPI002FD86104